MICRIYAYESGDGPSNMALDEAMLVAVADDPSCAMLRTYGWTEPTLSLGYFQEIAEAEADPRWRGVPLVRRPTGGGAIWHHHELTYALVVPTTHPLGQDRIALYRKVHAAIGALLRARGVEADRRGEASLSRQTRRPFLCFADRDPEDLVARGAKIVGSAQRRRSAAILQHGSLLLKRSPTTHELPGALDHASIDPEPRSWAGGLCELLPRELGLDPATEPLPDAIRRRAVEFEGSVYRDEAWNRKR